MSKVAIQGNASGTGVFTVASPNSNTDRTLTLPDEAGTVLTTAGVPTSALPAGTVLQVQNASYTSYNYNNTNSTSYIYTGLYVQITPSSATSKILLLFHVGMSLATSAGAGCILAIARNSSILNNGGSNFGGTYMSSGAANLFSSSHQTYLDSPNTTSTIAYRLYGRSSNGNVVYLTYQGSNVNLTAIEVAA